MKKVLLAIILLIPFSVFAAPAVLTLDATVEGSTINYKGTIEDGSFAVMCKLYDASDDELDILSSSVDTNAFEGAFTVTQNGKYKVSCANYEGGDVKTVEVEVKDTKDSKNNPGTGDNIVLYIILGVVALVGITFTTVKLVKKNNK